MAFDRDATEIERIQHDLTDSDGVSIDINNILDAVDLPIIVIGRECGVARFNRAAGSVLRLRTADIGHPLGDVLPSIRNLGKFCTQVIVDRAQFGSEIRDGQRSFLLRIAPFMGSDREIAGAVLTFTNVTAFRASIDQAIHEREFTKAILNTVIEPLVVLDRDLRVQTANQAFYRMFRTSRDETRGIHLYTLGKDDWKTSSLWEALRTIVSENIEFQTVEVERDFPEIGRRTLLVDAHQLSRQGDSMLLLALRDITERVRQYEALQTANAALGRANADLQQFAYSASHDLQEPLRTVAIFSDLLQKKFGGQLGKTGDEYIRQTLQGAMRMESLLKSLRMYTQVATTGSEPTEDIDAGEILQKALLDLEVSIRDSGASISNTALPHVRMYDIELEQLFLNLIGNAIRYRSELPPRIDITSKRQDEEWLFSVQDNGIGIESQFHEQIFGIFKRLHGAAQYPGTGMGLAICQRIVERAGGRIWVESESGKGSTFHFTIPIHKTSGSVI